MLDARLLQHLAQQPLGQRLDLGGEAPPARLVALERLAVGALALGRLALAVIVRDEALEVRAVVVAVRVVALHAGGAPRVAVPLAPLVALRAVRRLIRVRVRVR